MFTYTTYLKRNLFVYITLICITCMPRIVNAIEPIAKIGKPIPEKHAFINNETYVRVVPTHIQIVDTDTSEVIDEFGYYTDIRDVWLSSAGSHVAIMNYDRNTKEYTLYVWDVNDREMITELRIGYRVEIGVFSPTQPLLATSIDNEISIWN